MNDTRLKAALIRLLIKRPEFREKLAAEIRKIEASKKQK